MDIGGSILRVSGFTAGAPPELIGKWLQSAIRGHVFVGDIRTSMGNPVPLSRFLLYHYIIGVMLTFLFYFIISLFKITPLPWWAPLFYGLTTTLIPASPTTDNHFDGLVHGISGHSNTTRTKKHEPLTSAWRKWRVMGLIELMQLFPKPITSRYFLYEIHCG